MEENNLNLLSSCVLCNNTNYFGNGEGGCNDGFQDAGNDQSGKLVKSLWILCNVICEGKLDEAERTRLRNITLAKIESLKSGKLPCDGCTKALLELFRIQKIFEETQQLLTEVTSRIKHVLRAEDSEDAADGPNVKEETVNDDSEGESDLEFIWSSPDPSLDGNESLLAEPKFLPTEEVELTHKLNQSPEKVKREKSNSSKELVHKSSTGAHFSIKECSVVLTRINTQISSNGGTKHTNRECINAPDLVARDNVKVTEAERHQQKSPPRTITVVPCNKRAPKVRKLMKYYLVTEELLLLQCTPVKFQTGQLSCMESQCGYIAKVVENSPFEKMTSHIASQHEGNCNYTKQLKICPVCEKGFANGTLFRKHILSAHVDNGVKSNHNLRRIMCEICCRTIVSLDYSVHRWTHKSDSEKLAAAEIGDYVPSINKLTAHDQRLLGVLDESIIKRRRQWTQRHSQKKLDEIRQQKLLEGGMVGDTANDPKISISSIDVDHCKKSILNGERIPTNKHSPRISGRLAKKKAESRKTVHQQSSFKKSITLENSLRKASNVDNTPKIQKFMKYYYYFVNEELLLFLCTPIKFQTAQLMCLESDCGYMVEGTDCSTFQTMTSHVANEHEMNYSAEGSLKACPICENVFATGVLLRKHILNVHVDNGVKRNHNLRRVMCEICCRTVASVDYNTHKWTHKNDSEKLSAVENEEFAPSVCKLTLYDQRLLGVLDESIIKKRRQNAKQYSQNKWNEIRQQKLHGMRMTGNTSKNPKISQSNKDVNQCKKRNLNGRKKTANKYLPSISRLLAKKKGENKKAAHRQSNSNETPTESNIPKVHRFMKYYYYFVNEELLLLLCTPIKFQAPQLKCLESDCGYMAEGSDCSTFQMMTSHVANEHETNYSNEGILRVCPICEGDFATGALLRKHIFCAHVGNGKKSDHNSRRIMCEICRRTVVSLDYSSHKWTHKNDSEKLAAVEKGDYVPHVRKLSRHDQELLGVLDERIIKKRRATHKSYKLNAKRKCEEYKKQGHQVNSNSSRLATGKNGDNYIPPNSDLSINEENNLEVYRTTEKVNRKETATSPINESTAEVDTVSGNCLLDIDENNGLLLLLQDGLLYHDGALIKFTKEEFLCQVKNCGMKIERSHSGSFENLRSHVIYGHRTGPITLQNRECPLCQSQFEEVDQLGSHLITEHSPPALCPNCWKSFSDYDDLAEHVNSLVCYTSEVVRKQQKPPRIFPSRAKNSSGNYACGSCPKEFKLVGDLRAHEQVHIPKHLREKFDCPACGQKFLSKVAVRYHIDKRHRPELVTKKRVCKFCGKQYHYREGELYRIHLRRHTGETPFVCEVCGKGFIRHDSLKKHFKAHTNERPFQCEVCGKNYKFKKGLRQHTKVAHKNMP